MESNHGRGPFQDPALPLSYNAGAGVLTRKLRNTVRPPRAQRRHRPPNGGRFKWSPHRESNSATWSTKPGPSAEAGALRASDGSRTHIAWLGRPASCRYEHTCLRADDGIRTHDFFLTKEGPCHLATSAGCVEGVRALISRFSTGRVRYTTHASLVGHAGIEPATSDVSGRRSPSELMSLVGVEAFQPDALSAPGRNRTYMPAGKSRFLNQFLLRRRVRAIHGIRTRYLLHGKEPCNQLHLYRLSGAPENRTLRDTLIRRATPTR